MFLGVISWLIPIRLSHSINTCIELSVKVSVSTHCKKNLEFPIELEGVISNVYRIFFRSLFLHKNHFKIFFLLKKIFFCTKIFFNVEFEGVLPGQIPPRIRGGKTSSNLRNHFAVGCLNTD